MDRAFIIYRRTGSLVASCSGHAVSRSLQDSRSSSLHYCFCCPKVTLLPPPQPFVKHLPFLHTQATALYAHLMAERRVMIASTVFFVSVGVCLGGVKKRYSNSVIGSYRNLLIRCLGTDLIFFMMHPADRSSSLAMPDALFHNLGCLDFCSMNGLIAICQLMSRLCPHVARQIIHSLQEKWWPVKRYTHGSLRETISCAF